MTLEGVVHQLRGDAEATEVRVDAEPPDVLLLRRAEDPEGTDQSQGRPRVREAPGVLRAGTGVDVRQELVRARVDVGVVDLGEAGALLVDEDVHPQFVEGVDLLGLHVQHLLAREMDLGRFSGGVAARGVRGVAHDPKDNGMSAMNHQKAKKIPTFTRKHEKPRRPAVLPGFSRKYLANYNFSV
jgi:hypothetical protein